MTDNVIDIKNSYSNTYIPIEGVQTIVETLIKNIYQDPSYQAYLDDINNKKSNIIHNTFDTMQVFNTYANPLFLAKDIGVILGLSNINTTIKNYNSKEKVVGFILDSKKEKQFLTRHGVYRLLFNSRTKLSELFRGFIYELIDHMWFHEIEKRDEIMKTYLNDNPELVKESITELHTNYQRYIQLYNLEKEKNDQLLDDNNYLKIENNYNSLMLNNLQYENDLCIEKIQSKKSKVHTHDEFEQLEVLKKLYMKEISILIIKPEQYEKFLNSKKVKNKDLDIDEKELLSAEEYNKNYNFAVNKAHKDIYLIDEIDLCFHLSYLKKEDDSSKEILIDTDWVKNKNSFTEICNTLKEECLTFTLAVSKTAIHITTLSHIKLIIADNLLH